MPTNRRKRSFFSPDIHILMDVIGVILVWRGIWVLTDRYLFPDNPDVSAIISIILGIIILYVENKNLKELK
jgi:hypothetical protein